MFPQNWMLNNKKRPAAAHAVTGRSLYVLFSILPALAHIHPGQRLGKFIQLLAGQFNSTIAAAARREYRSKPLQ